MWALIDGEVSDIFMLKPKDNGNIGRASRAALLAYATSMGDSELCDEDEVYLAKELRELVSDIEKELSTVS